MDYNRVKAEVRFQACDDSLLVFYSQVLTFQMGTVQWSAIRTKIIINTEKYHECTGYDWSQIVRLFQDKDNWYRIIYSTLGLYFIYGHRFMTCDENYENNNNNNFTVYVLRYYCTRVRVTSQVDSKIDITNRVHLTFLP